MSEGIELSKDHPNPYLLPPWQMQAVGLAAMLVATVLIFWAATSATHFELPVAQYAVCVGISLYLAVFFYVFWPQKSLEAEVKPFFATKEFRVAGPIILFFMSFGILYTAMPKHDRAYVQIFAPEDVVYYDRNTTVERKDKKPLTYYLIPKAGSAKLEWIYVEFSLGEQTIEAVFTHNQNSKRVRFNRGEGTFITIKE